MRTIEVPIQRWADFFKRLGANVARRPVRLTVENTELGDQEMADLVPLQGFDLDHGTLEILAGDGDELLSHRIERPSRVYALIDEDDAIVCLCIEQEAGGGQTLVYFEEWPSLPQALEEGEQPAAP